MLPLVHFGTAEEKLDSFARLSDRFQRIKCLKLECQHFEDYSLGRPAHSFGERLRSSESLIFPANGGFELTTSGAGRWISWLGDAKDIGFRSTTFMLEGLGAEMFHVDEDKSAYYETIASCFYGKER